jgi:hypothetical protein
LNNAQQHQILNDLYVQACGSLLSAYGLTVDIHEWSGGKSPHKKSYISLLSATGEGISLSSMLKIDRDLVVSIHPLGRGEVTQGDLKDWTRELNNQLVGRLKNKLLGYGHAVTIGLPILIRGTDVSPIAASDSEVREYSMQSAQGQIILTLATLINPEIELLELECPMDGEPVLLEGAIALF